MKHTLEEYREALENTSGPVRDGILEEARETLGLSYMETYQLAQTACPDWA